MLPVILADDWTFVTKNSVDFRGPADAPGSKGEYRVARLHAGLICLNGPVGMDLDMQLELFSVALDALGDDSDLVNGVIEATMDDSCDSEIVVVRYALPSE